ncbi:hypothetical protein QIW31_08915, partial [Francisellaceae bacterium CB299]
MNNENKDLISIIKDTPKEDGFANIQDKWDEIYEAYDNGKVDEYLHLFQIRSYCQGTLLLLHPVDSITAPLHTKKYTP